MPERIEKDGEYTARDWSLKEIKKLIDLLIERDIAEFELEAEGARVRIRRGDCRSSAGAAAAAAAPAPAPVSAVTAAAPAAAPAPPASPNIVAPAEAAPSESTDSLYIIKSPLVGTFYASPSPKAEPFVNPGDAVRVGQVLCIIEAMKLMNEIECEVNGEVVRIYPENGQPVEYGQSLFAIKPSMKK